jgi:hypothetical protein
MALAKYILALTLGLSSLAASAKDNDNLPDEKNFPSFFSGPASASPEQSRLVDSVYNKIGLFAYNLNKNVFYQAYKGYQYLLSKGVLRNINYLTIADYSQSSTNKRLYVIDLKEGRVLFNTYVSHGKNSGREYATSFSNSNSSNKSSLGFMVTDATYKGKAGYSLILNGLEQGINDNVRERHIVMHGSRFVNDRRIWERGAIANSLGCPAIPAEDSKRIIDVIKGGTLFFSYSPDEMYTRTSSVLNANFQWPSLIPQNTATTEPSGNAVQTSFQQQ